MTRTGPGEAALVLDAQGRAGIEALQSLGRAGMAVDVAASVEAFDERPLAFASRYARRRLLQPAGARADELARWIAERDAEAPYALVVPSTEASLVALRTLPENADLRRRAVMPGDDALDVALDKASTWSLARRLGVPVPDARLVASRDVPPPSRYPCVLKPLRSMVRIDGRLVVAAPVVVRDEARWRAAITRWLPYTALQEQEWVAGHGVGIELLYAGGRARWHFAHRRLHEWPLTGGGSSYRRAIEAPREMLAAARTLLDELHWHGVAMVEFRVAPDGKFRLMEINPRLWGSLALSIDAGVDFPLGLRRLARGEDPGPQPRYDTRRRTRHVVADVEWQKENARADHGDPLLLTRPRARALLEWLLPLTGLERWDHVDPRDPVVALRMLGGMVHAQAGGLLGKLARPIARRRAAAAHERLLRRGPGRPLGNVLVLCYGNICRSPVAAALLRQALPEGVVVESAGFHAHVGRASPANILAAAAEVDPALDLDAHRSARVTAEQVQRADLVLLMDADNWRRFAREFPGAVGRAALLGHFDEREPGEIADPYGWDVAATSVIVRKIERAARGLSAWARRWVATRDASSPPALTTRASRPADHAARA